MAEWIRSPGRRFLTRGVHSYHMCPKREWYSTYKEFSGIVLMENNVSCKTIGIGNIKIKMFDGVVRTLVKIRHVPNLKKNLISLDAFYAP